MRKFSTLLLGVMLLSFGDAASHAQQRREGQLSPSQIAQKALGAVVVIKATEDLKRYRYGSGFFVKNNLIATNYHVVKGLSRISAHLVGRNKEYVCFLVVQDEENDLAVLRVQGFQTRALQLSATPSKVGEEIYVLSNPEGYEGTFTRGMVNAYRANGEIQIDAPVSHGSSGGPVLDRRGQVVAIVRESNVEGQNLNFAIPVSMLASMLLYLEVKGDRHAAPYDPSDPLGIHQFLRSSQAGKPLDSLRDGASRLADQVKALSRFLYLFGGVAKRIESIDDAVRRNQASSVIVDLNQRDKATLTTAMRNIRQALDKLEVDFSTNPKLQRFYIKLAGVAAGATAAEQQAAESRFDDAGRTLLSVFNQLVDVLNDMTTGAAD